MLFCYLTKQVREGKKDKKKKRREEEERARKEAAKLKEKVGPVSSFNGDTLVHIILKRSFGAV